MIPRRCLFWALPFSVAAVLPLLASGCTPETAEPVIVHKTAVEHGEAIFNDPEITGTDLNVYSCATCHGEQTSAGPLLPGGSLRGVTGRPSYWGGQEIDLLRSVNACLYYFMLADQPWTKEDEEARALYGYLESISEGQSTEPVPFTVVLDIVDLPAGDAKRGEAMYGRACAPCHGPSHTGSGRLVERAPVLPETTLEQHPLGEYTKTDQRLVFVEKARYGAFHSYTGQMPPFSLEVLSDEGMADILQYLDLYKE